MAVPKVAPFYGNAPFILETGDLTSAIASGLLRPNVFVQQTDRNLENYGVAYSRKDNIGIETHGSQKAIQTRCKEFAKSCGFQLKVAGFSSKHGGGNAKYVCKKLNGQQFFDKEADQGAISCPFFFNVSGVAGEWKVIRANFCHNHLKNVGFSGRPVAEGTIARPDKDLWNTTQQVDEMIRLVRSEMLNKYEGKTDRMTGAAIAKFLLGKGISTGRSSISRIKLTLDELNHGDRLTNYQNLESYLKLMAEKKMQARSGNSRRTLMELFSVPASFQVSVFEWQERVGVYLQSTVLT
ncbi:hypothetical protein PPTG_18734 [Phytophthora nicotianae INRA-310]|uniref:Uncharacterized protein n=1 Tax=Phytophthora nicotianae (strain INRA-310) TaxID=761204 RepID=W2PHJ2_PHYN3|nr:hypothetical protein PPTG_18734 [Phytophthora nicotianae INRA-310]ETM99479.1 hypothetical protein PPTG_18734 [Phytophthora nicotianae INRA-310]